MSYSMTSLGRTYYLRKGRKTKPAPLIGIHGGPGGLHKTLLPLFELRNDRQVALYDQYGSGKSDHVDKEKWVIPTFTRQLHELRTDMGWDDVFLVGSSWGGTLLLEYMREYGQKGIRGAVFQSTMFNAKLWSKDAEGLIGRLPKETQKVIRYCEEIGATDSQVYQNAMMDYYSRFVCRKKETMEFVRKLLGEVNHDIYGHMWGSSEFNGTGTLRDYDGTGFLNKLTVPVLFICGEYDESTPDTNRRFCKMIPNGQVTVLDDAAHLCLMDATDDYLAALRFFFLENES